MKKSLLILSAFTLLIGGKTTAQELDFMQVFDPIATPYVLPANAFNTLYLGHPSVVDQDLINSTWTNVEKISNPKNAQGNYTEMKVYAWNSTSSAWELSETDLSFTYTYDGSNKLTSFIRTYNDLSTGDIMKRVATSMTYNGSNQLTQIVFIDSLYDVANGSWFALDGTDDFVYAGSLLSERTTMYSYMGISIPVSKKLYSYNGNNCIEELTQADDNGTWVDDEKLTFTYTGNNMTNITKTVYNTDISAWETESTTIYTYDAQNRVSTGDFDGDTHAYTYNANNKISEVLIDEFDGTAMVKSKVEVTYDANNMPEIAYSYAWNGTGYETESFERTLWSDPNPIIDLDGDGVSSTSDCNDNDPNVYQNLTVYIDVDADGYDNGSSTICMGVAPPSGYILNTLGSDCNDNDAAINPGATDIPDNGIDEDCNGSDATSSPVDNDGDGHDNTSDCDDNDPNVFQNLTVYIDNDLDGYDNGTALICMGTTPPSGYSLNSLGIDCDDFNSNVNPGATEIPNNGIDDDCLGGDETTIDADGDGYDSVSDCDDNDPSVYQNVAVFVDYDGDNYDSGTQTICMGDLPPIGYILITMGSDCNDSEISINSGATDIPDNGIDEDCNGSDSLSIPNAPTDLVVVPVKANQTLRLTWTDNADNETGFKVERSTDGTNFTLLADLTAANTTTYDDTNLPDATTYYYKVLAYNTTGNSAYSNIVQATSSGASLFDVVLENVTVYPNPFEKEFTVNWNSDATYMIYSLNGNIVKEGKISTGTNTISLSTVQSGSYFLKIVSKDGVSTSILNKQ
ncbi:MAG: T9SS type A sorting domain-containing protein [Flavobacteriia bacterium]|nr:T9SS type A sorting domain-containing protein [Flavobacteriia bacterium]